MRAICIHGHFYQPPREDPWLDEVLKDPTAAPAHDWNHRVADECYVPNSASRLVNNENKITYITNNYQHLNFNIGPTLHHWIAHYRPDLAGALLEADKNALRENGTSGAIAQAYNHMILPLALPKDINTQIAWGIEDFQFRFGRAPVGMWLPETAANTATLEELAKNGIEYTILAPGQCAAVRNMNGSWVDTPGGQGLDVTRPYRVVLPSGRTMTLIFYHGGIAQGIAFGGLLDSGDRFADSLLASLPRDDEPRLLVVATDGESYGHHHRFGEMALARAFQKLFQVDSSEVTNIEGFLKNNPITWECRIVENSSWSCAHGVERWRSDCGCHTGGEFGWNQKWRAPLREGLDRLRDKIDALFEEHMDPLCYAPWTVRNASIELFLVDWDKPLSTEQLLQQKERFLREHMRNSRAGHSNSQVLALLEAQRMRQFMYTSCGWFFNDVAGIETRQILAYALRATELMRQATGVDLEPEFLADMQEVHGNRTDLATAFAVIQKEIQPNRKSIRDVAAIAALTDCRKNCYGFHIHNETKTFPSGDITLRASRLHAIDPRTLEKWQGTAVVFSSGALDDICRLSENSSLDEIRLRKEFYQGDLFSFSRYAEDVFKEGPWHLNLLPQELSERIASNRNHNAILRYLDTAQNILEDNRRLLVQLHFIGATPPALLSAAATLVINERLSELAEDCEHFLDLLEDGSELATLIENSEALGISPDFTRLAPHFIEELQDLLKQGGQWNKTSKQEHPFERALHFLKKAKKIGIKINPWPLQNELWFILVTLRTPLSSTLVEIAEELGFETPKQAS